MYDSAPDSPVSESQSEQATTIASSTIKTAKNRRALLDEKRENHKQDKLKRKLPVDSQLLTCAQEEFQIKKQLLDNLTPWISSTLTA